MSDVKLGTTPTNAVDDSGNPVVRDPGLSAAFDKIAAPEAPAIQQDPPEVDVQPAADQVEPEAPIVDTPAPATETPPADPAPAPAAAQDDDVLTDDDIKRMPRSQAKKIAKIREKIKEYEAKLQSESATRAEKEKTLADYEAKVKQLEEQQQQFDPEAFKRTEEELLQYRRLHALAEDPRLKAQYDEPLKRTDESIIGILKKHGMQDSQVAVIRQSGGWQAWAEKNTELANEVFAKLSDVSRADVAMIQANLAEQVRLQRERESFIANETTAARSWFEQQQKQIQERQQLSQAEQTRLFEENKKWLEETSSRVEFLKQDPIPATATPEEKARIQKLNGQRAQLRQVAQAALSVDTPEARRSIALLAASAEWHLAGKKALEAENAALKAQMAKLRPPQRTVPPSGTGAAAPTKGVAPKTPPTLTEALNLIAQGRDPNASTEE